MSGCDVLVTNAWCRTAYACVRSYKRLGLRVGVADTSHVGMAQWSRHVSFRGVYASPYTEPTRFCHDVADLLRRSGAHFLLPGHDETEVVARHRSSLPPSVAVPLADYAKIHYANDKAYTLSLAIESGVPVPERVQWSTLSKLQEGVAALGDRAVVIRLRKGNGAKGVYYAESAQEAVAICRRLCREYRVPATRLPLVQERVCGEGWGVSCLYWDGRHVASFTHRRVREKTGAGGTSTVRQAARNALLEAYARALLDRLGWHGLAMVEFKYDPATRQAWFIEINPRLWGSLHLAIAAGVDFPAMLYLMSCGRSEEAVRMGSHYQEGLTARWYAGDVMAGLRCAAHGRLREALVRLVPGGADTYDDWFVDDPLAVVGQWAHYLHLFLKYRSTNPVQEGMLG